MDARTERKRLVMRRYMGFVYLGGVVLWIVVGAQHAMPKVVVWLAIAFCLVRAWMSFRPVGASGR